jgi:hypothetical protein
MADGLRKGQKLAHFFLSSNAFITFGGIFLALIVAVIYGLIYTSGKFSESLYKPGGELLDGLIAGGISVIISTILITPLTAYFVALRREQQLVPVRRNFVHGIANSIDELAVSFIHHIHLYGFSVMALRDSMAGNTIKLSLETFNKKLERMRSRLSREKGSQDGEMEKANQGVETQEDSILAVAITEAKLVREQARDFNDQVYREARDLDNTVMFAMPLFPVEALNDLYAIRQTLIDYRESVKDMLAVMEGETDPRAIARAKFSALDFEALRDKITIIAKSSMADELANMPNVARLLEVMQVYDQTKISSMLVDIFVDARRYDLQLQQMQDS